MDANVTIQDPAAEPELERRLRNEQQLELMGALAGFIAHDLNNELTVILGNVGLALDLLDVDHPLREGLAEAQRACHRSVDMTRALLSLGQKVKPEFKPVELDPLLQATERILRKVLPTAGSAKFAKHAQLPAIMADASQIQQVVMNLAANASRAMPEESLLEVQARNGPRFVTILISVSSVGRLPEGAKRQYVPISVVTANQGAGTFGLGRDIEIVRAHGGSIDMAREPASVTFRISLPSAVRRPLAEVSACVLIAEDESPVRRAAVQILLRKGYNVLEAGDGSEALRVFRENKDTIDLVFLDASMPGLSGTAALNEMRRSCPKIKVLVASSSRSGLANAHFLAKPYSPLDLVRRIQSVLAGEALTSADEPASA
jgi:two-component system cell cycle sensor histidine kinase/response regulator CckA